MVEKITGVPQLETVPDAMVRAADQVEMVDMTPEALRRRMPHGNIYPADQVPQALAHFFRAGNLAVLRQLALWFLAGETEEELLGHLARYQSGIPWDTTERIMASVTTAPGTEAVVRRASQLAARIKAELHIAHIADDAVTRPSRDERLASVRQVAADVGATWHELDTDDPAGALLPAELLAELADDWLSTVLVAARPLECRAW